MAGMTSRRLETVETDKWNNLVKYSNSVQLNLFAYDSSLRRYPLGRRILDNSQAPAPPPTPPTQRHTGFATPDPIVVIILGIILFALICAAFLNSVLRCLLRRRRLGDLNRAFEAATEALVANGGGGSFPVGPGPAAHGLEPKILHSLPVLEFLKKESSNVENLRAGDCSICLSEFSEKEKLRLLPKCSHIFHVDCVDVWLRAHTSCPVCRDTIVEDNGGVPAVRLSPEEVSNGASLVASRAGAVAGPGVLAGAGASAVAAESGLMLLIQDENGHSVAAMSGFAQQDAPSLRLAAMNTAGVESNRQSFVAERGQPDEQGVQLVPLRQGVQLVPLGHGVGGDAGNAASERSSTAGSKTYLVFEAGYFFSGRWMASSSSASSSSVMSGSSSGSASQSGVISSSQSSATSAPQSSAFSALKAGTPSEAGASGLSGVQETSLTGNLSAADRKAASEARSIFPGR